MPSDLPFNWPKFRAVADFRSDSDPPGWKSDDPRLDVRARFWHRVHEFRRLRDGDAKLRPLDEEERLLEANFGPELRKQFLVHFGTAAAEQLAALNFSARVAGYGSITVDVACTALGALGKFVGGDVDLVKELLVTYVPLALRESVDINSLDNPFGCTITTDAAFNLAFASEKPVAAPKLAERTMNWVWIVANASLVVPVALAMAVLLVEAGVQGEKRAELVKREEDIAKREAELQKAFTDRGAIILGSAIDLVRAAKCNDPAASSNAGRTAAKGAH